MLVKCACPHCGHSYLCDDSAGDLACPRCNMSNEVGRNASDIPSTHPPVESMFHEPFADPLGSDAGYAIGTRFDPQGPPPMIITGERFLRGAVFGSLGGILIAAVLGAALSALGFVVPGVGMILAGLFVSVACRYGFGGKAAPQTRAIGFLCVILACTLSLAGFYAGSWTVERLTGSRAQQTREDLDNGLHNLVRERGRTRDPSTAVVLDQRIAEVERLRRRSDPRLEDYLWVQEAQINQPFLAYAKLRATVGPVLRLGVEAKPVTLPVSAKLGVVGLELVLAIWLARRGALSR